MLNQPVIIVVIVVIIIINIITLPSSSDGHQYVFSENRQTLLLSASPFLIPTCSRWRP